MKKDGIKIMILGLGLTIISAFFYFFNVKESINVKSLVSSIDSAHFNWLPMIGISIMAFGEFLLWQSQHNKNLNEVRTKLLNRIRIRMSNLKLGLIYISHSKLINMKVVRFIVSIFHI